MTRKGYLRLLGTGIVLTAILVSLPANIFADDQHAAIAAAVADLRQRDEASLSPSEKMQLDYSVQRLDDTVVPLLKKATAAEIAENWSEAAGYLQSVVRQTETPSVAMLYSYKRLALCYKRLGLRDRSDAELRLAISRGEELLADNQQAKWAPLLVLCLADLYLDIGRLTQPETERCDEIIDKLATYEGTEDMKGLLKSFLVPLYRAQLRNRQCKPEEALVFADLAVKSTKNAYSQAVCLYERGIANRDAGKISSSIEDLQDSLELLLAHKSNSPAEIKASEVTIQLIDLGVTPEFPSEDSLVRVFLRLCSAKEDRAVRALCINAGNETLNTRFESLGQQLTSGRCLSLDPGDSVGEDVTVRATVAFMGASPGEPNGIIFRVARSDGKFWIREFEVEETASVTR